MPTIRRKNVTDTVIVKTKVKVVTPCLQGCNLKQAEYEIFLGHPDWVRCPICGEPIVVLEPITVDADET